MTPPPFNDIGKQVKDLFSKGYAHGVYKVDVTTDATPTVQFKSGASHNITSQKMNGNLEVKYKVPEHGLTLTEKWNTDNQISTIAELNNKIANGLKVIIDTSYNPNNSKRSALLKTEWAGEAVHVNADLTLFGGPLINLAAVAELRHGWLIGGQAKYDVASSEIKATTLAVGRKTPNFTLNSFTVDGREFGASLFHRVHENLEYGVLLGWKLNEQMVTWGMATKYEMSKDLTVRAKVDNKSQISLAATHSLTDACKLTFATQFALTGALDSKIGVGLEYKG